MPRSGTGKKLAPDDFVTAAQELACEVAAVRAVAKVESKKAGFDDKGRPTILFEGHIFHRNTQPRGKYDSTHPHLSKPTWQEAKQYYKLDQWERLKEAMTLDEDAALRSASWGVFQVMGFNYKAGGWHSVREFVLAMFESEKQHLRAFIGYCKQNHLTQYLKSQAWAKFALGYNGPGYADNRYDVLIRNAYEEFSKTA
jgi:hypothetical protein